MPESKPCWPRPDITYLITVAGKWLCHASPVICFWLVFWTAFYRHKKRTRKIKGNPSNTNIHFPLWEVRLQAPRRWDTPSSTATRGRSPRPSSWESQNSLSWWERLASPDTTWHIKTFWRCLLYHHSRSCQDKQRLIPRSLVNKASNPPGRDPIKG